MSLAISRGVGQSVVVTVPPGTKIPPEGLKIAVMITGVRGKTIRLGVIAPRVCEVERDNAVKDANGNILREPRYKRGTCSICSREGTLQKFKDAQDLSDRWICGRESCISRLKIPASQSGQNSAGNSAAAS